MHSTLRWSNLLISFLAVIETFNCNPKKMSRYHLEEHGITEQVHDASPAVNQYLQNFPGSKLWQRSTSPFPRVFEIKFSWPLLVVNSEQLNPENLTANFQTCRNPCCANLTTVR